MKITTKVRYSIRFMIDLATHGTKNTILLKDISRRQEISEKYMGHFVPLLKSAGLITAKRGARGGVTLARSADTINLREIIEAVEGSICLVDCVSDAARCKRSSSCAARDFWDEVNDGIVRVFEAYKLSELVERQRVKNEVHSYTI